MKRYTSWLVSLAAATMLVSAASGMDSMPGSQAVVRLGPPGPPSLVAEEPGYSAKKAGANIIVTYVGFSAPAKAAFQRAVNIWKTKITSSVPIRVRAQWANLGNTGILGSAGPLNFLSCPSGCPPKVIPNTWYPVALANKLTGADNDPTHDDIQAQFNNTFSAWHFGATPAPAGKIDFESVVLHELGHGLGFLGSGKLVNGNTQGSVQHLSSSVKRPTIWDRFTANAAKTKLITFPDPSATLKTLMTNNNLYFQINATTRYRLFAPATFQPGSSYSHLNEASFPKGNPNSLMTPAIGAAETIRNPGTIVAAMFKAMGW